MDGGSSSGDSESAGSGQAGAGSSESSSSSSRDKARSVFEDFAKEIKATLSPATDITSATCKYSGPVASSEGYTGTSSLVVTKREPTAWEKMWDKVRAP
jgi:hypothetical protein